MSDCPCTGELEQQSPLSPGLVGDDEQIVYALIDPLTADAGGEVLSVLNFSKSKLQAGTLSVCRAGHTTASSARENIVGALQVKDPSRKDCGFLTAACESIRGIMLGASAFRAFCVNDAGLEGFEAHAHISNSETTDQKLLSHRLAARGNLKLVFEEGGVNQEWSGHPFRPG